jgi:hypothetical protein
MKEMQHALQCVFCWYLEKNEDILLKRHHITCIIVKTSARQHLSLFCAAFSNSYSTALDISDKFPTYPKINSTFQRTSEGFGFELRQFPRLLIIGNHVTTGFLVKLINRLCKPSHVILCLRL